MNNYFLFFLFIFLICNQSNGLIEINPNDIKLTKTQKMELKSHSEEFHNSQRGNAHNHEFKMLGAVDGGGIDFDRWFQGKSWFVTNDIINFPFANYCIEIDDTSLSISKKEIERVFDNAISRWFGYVDDNFLDKPIYADESNHRWVRDFKVQAECNEFTNLKVYIGKETKELKEHFKSNYLPPIAYSMLTGVNKVGQDQGMIWLNVSKLMPYVDWNIENIELALTHELGHVLGNKDTPGTIMGPELAVTFMSYGDDSSKVIKERALIKKHFLRNMEASSFLYEGHSGNEKLKRVVRVGDFGGNNIGNRKKITSLFFGKDLKFSKTRSILKLDSRIAATTKGEIEFVADKESVKYNLIVRDGLSKIEPIAGSFGVSNFAKNISPNKKQRHLVGWPRAFATVVAAQLVNQKDESIKFDVLIHENSNFKGFVYSDKAGDPFQTLNVFPTYPIRISLPKGGQFYNLFYQYEVFPEN